MNERTTHGTASPLPSANKSDDDAVVEQCIEELDELVMSLDCYPPAAVAVAIGTYLEGLLGALFDERQCTADEVRELLREIESGVLESSGPKLENGDSEPSIPDQAASLADLR